MKTALRDDVLSKNKQLIRVLISACLALSVSVLMLASVSVYALLNQTTTYLPTHLTSRFQLSKFDVSPEYLSQMASDIMQLRLTWNSDTIINQYQQLLHLVSIDQRPLIKQALNAEIKSVQKRHMSSVFYQSKHPLVDVKAEVVRLEGQLQRVDDGVILAPVKRTYEIQFKYHLGLLSIQSIREVKAHA